jgi:AcrR family transcriptional regulator
MLREGPEMHDEEVPRRRNAAKTKAMILAAAQQAFADTGYTQTGIRAIAALAGVDSALVQRYFGSKAGLFESALADAIPRFETADLERAGLGKRVMSEFLLGLDLRAQSMIVLSTSDAEAREIAAAVLKARVIEPVTGWLGAPDGEARAIRLVMLSTAFMLYTRQVQLMTPESAIASGTSQWLSDTLQSILEEPVTSAPPPLSAST